MPNAQTQTQAHCCPACGRLGCDALECLQRPRFFGGQLLTERELNALQDYFLAKNRLHNRMLHGSGTVCGLEVARHECPGWIRIQPGYAIDPCGNDIVVCEPYEFDLLKAIRACCARERRQQDCGYRLRQENPDCLEGDQVWCVALRYDEQSIRPIAPLLRDKARACKNCGSHGRCGCGPCAACGNQPQTCSCSCPPSRSREPIECEPTRTAEGWQVEVCRSEGMCGDPKQAHARDRWSGTMLGRITDILACLRGPRNKERISNYGLQGSQNLSQFLAYGSKDPISQCLCPAIIPPCPSTEGDTVCLACVRIEKGEITEICNLSCRTFAGSFPTLNYWLPVGKLALSALCELCCSSDILSKFILKVKTRGGVQEQREASSAVPVGAATKPEIDKADLQAIAMAIAANMEGFQRVLQALPTSLANSALKALVPNAAFEQQVPPDLSQELFLGGTDAEYVKAAVVSRLETAKKRAKVSTVAKEELSSGELLSLVNFPTSVPDGAEVQVVEDNGTAVGVRIKPMANRLSELEAQVFALRADLAAAKIAVASSKKRAPEGGSHG